MVWKVTHTEIDGETLTRLEMGPIDFTMTEAQLVEFLVAVTSGETATITNPDSELVIIARNPSFRATEEWFNFIWGDSDHS